MYIHSSMKHPLYYANVRVGICFNFRHIFGKMRLTKVCAHKSKAMTSVAINSCVTISLTHPISANSCNLQVDALCIGTQMGDSVGKMFYNNKITMLDNHLIKIVCH